MRPYTWDARTRSYAVKDTAGNTVHRRTRTAAGMMATNARARRWAKGDALTLCVHGTLAKRSPLHFRTRAADPKRCPCCGHTSRKLALNDSGRARLKRLRTRRIERLLDRFGSVFRAANPTLDRA